MLDYLFSFHNLIFFIGAVLFTTLLDRRWPILCYLVWIFFLLKLFIPWGLHDVVIHRPLPFRLNWEQLYSSLEDHPSVAERLPPTTQTPYLSATDQLVRETMLEPAPNPSSARFFDPPFTWVRSNAILSVWVGISLFFLLNEFYITACVWNFIRRGICLNSGRIYDTARECSASIGLKNVPKIVASKLISVPFIFGFGKQYTYILVPHTFLRKKMPSDRLRMMLCHELMHLKKKDHWVNLLRFVCLLFFHVHPFRIVADWMLHRYQEITTDIRTIRVLGIRKESYITVLIEEFMKNSKSMNVALSSHFLIANASFIRRIFYLKYYISPSNRFTVLLGFLCFMATFSTAAVKVTFNASPYSTDTEIKLFFTPSPGFLPKPYSVSPPILHESYVVKKVHDGLLWVVEWEHGLYAYRLNEQDQLEPVVSHLFEKVGSENKSERAQDVEFYGKYIYLSVQGANTGNLTHSRIEILEWNGAGTLTKVGQMRFSNPTYLRVVDHYLYVTGFDPETIEGVLMEFDLKKDPLHPAFLDEAYYPLPANLLEYHREAGQILLGTNNAMYTYNVNSHLEGLDYCELPVNPMYFRFLPDRSVLAYGVNTRSMTPEGNFVLLADDGYGNYQVQYQKTIVVPQGKGSFVSDILPLDDRLLISIPLEGLALIRMDNDDWTVEHTEDTDAWIPVILGEKTVILHQDTAVYNTRSLFHPSDSIDSWRHMDDSGY